MNRSVFLESCNQQKQTMVVPVVLFEAPVYDRAGTIGQYLIKAFIVQCNKTMEWKKIQICEKISTKSAFIQPGAYIFLTWEWK